MSKVAITLTKQEIQEAVLDHINRKVTLNGRKQLQEPAVSFSNKDGDIGYFECIVEVEDKKPEKAS